MKKKVFSFILIIILTCIFLKSTYNIIIWEIDNKNEIKTSEHIEEVSSVNEVEDSDNTEIIEEVEENKTDYYYDYIKMNLIDVDFSSLKEINSDVVGWVRVNGTTINYPFVQTNNNDYYLKHSFDKSSNGAGWVFMDYRNNKNGDNKNTILYAHGRTNGRMFGDLKNILSSNWLKDPGNYIVRISTETENTLWQVFSIYQIPTTSDYIKTEFSSDEEYETWLNMLINRSNTNFNTTVNKDAKILTLSTCYNDTDKVVLHAKLIKKETK